MKSHQTILQGTTNMLIMALSKYHPIVIEGAGGSYDQRNPYNVAQICHRLLLESTTTTKPNILIIQGDPKEETGISAITSIVTKSLNIPRGLVCLDPDIDPDHEKHADRELVILELQYSQLLPVLEGHREGSVQLLKEKIDAMLKIKNEKRTQIGKSPLKDYYKDYALLQEVTKAACRIVCGNITVVHTTPFKDIHEFSITSFYKAGLELGFVQESDIVS